MKFGATEIILILGVLGVAFLPAIFFLRTLSNTLKEIHPDNRRMQPAEVWLELIPIYGMVWQFIVVNRLADSLKSEFLSRNIDLSEDRPGHALGIAYCILLLCSWIPVVGVVAAFAGFVCWIMYWVKISDFKSRLILHTNRG